ncbi:hypothetical protein CR513_32614, partial [Mucuna pruriens]
MCLGLSSVLEKLPTSFERILEEFKDVFQYMPKGLSPIRGIEHHIDFVPSSSLPNCLSYKSNAKLRKLQEEVLQKIELLSSLEDSSPSPSPSPTIYTVHEQKKEKI